MSCTQTAATPHTPYHRPLTSPALQAKLRGALFRRTVQRLALWLRRHQTRRVLRDLDAHMLRDIGLTRRQATYEAEKPFWVE
jgi:uncharacterized protein YjiS (DUF1127 family)